TPYCRSWWRGWHHTCTAMQRYRTSLESAGNHRREHTKFSHLHKNCSSSRCILKSREASFRTCPLETSGRVQVSDQARARSPYISQCLLQQMQGQVCQGKVFC